MSMALGTLVVLQRVRHVQRRVLRGRRERVYMAQEMVALSILLLQVPEGRRLDDTLVETENGLESIAVENPVSHSLFRCNGRQEGRREMAS
jgi:hypothetical protein